MIGYDLIGNTPLVLLETFSDKHVQIYAKLEQYNPGGSVKDRLGKFLVEHALEHGLVREGDTIVDASAGNTGIGLAIAANHFNLHCVIYTPEGFSEEKISIMRALGVQVERTPIEDGMQGAREAARCFAADSNAFYINQFETDLNPQAYAQTLGQEITSALSDIDYFVGGVGSGGTFTGVAQYLSQFNVGSVVVEPEGSILSSGEMHEHDIEGIGVEAWPKFLEKGLIADIIKVSDIDAFRNVKQLALQEGLLVGSSSGAALQGALEVKKHINKGVIVTIFPDGSDRYMSKQIFEYEENVK
ncbi:cysteine synthase family protein [Staphylococcus gallinarum]|uniref:cysteine synthase n=1 Tax=Staphylococcus gallinarum TaxID=1293 RepID=A0A3A0VTX1_STAGA|nr:cysteine synthase family protein [Staphylococcus gallinarum]RIP37126.1 cysteine synthase family protein [Staphylococcus gallinarum]